MALGKTAKRIQRVVDIAESSYERISDLHDRMTGLDERIEAIETEQTEQRAILEAIADERGIDPATVVETASATATARPDADATADTGPHESGGGDDSDGDEG